MNGVLLKLGLTFGVLLCASFCFPSLAQNLRLAHRGVTSFEFWLFRPDIPLAPVHETRRLPDFKFDKSIFEAEVRDNHGFLDISGISFSEGHVGIRAAQARLHVEDVSAGAGFQVPGFPRISSRGIAKPKWHTVHPRVYSARDAWFVVATKAPMQIPLPDEVELKFDRAGRVDLIYPRRLSDFLEAKIDSLLSAANYGENFRHWFVNLGFLDDKAAEFLAGKFRGYALAAVRERLKAEVRDPRFLKTLLVEINKSIPYIAAKDFTGLEAVLEKHRFVRGGISHVAWRLRPASLDPVFCEETGWQIRNHVFTQPSDTAVLALHAGAVDELFQKYFEHLYEGDTQFAQLPSTLERDPDRAWLTYRNAGSETSGLVLFFRDYLPALRTSSTYRISLAATGPEHPSLKIWLDSESKRKFLDLIATFFVWDPEVPGESPHSVRLRMSFEMGNGAVLRLVTISRAENPDGTVQAGATIPHGFGAVLKFFVLQSLLNSRIEQVAHSTKVAMDPRVALAGAELIAPAAKYKGAVPKSIPAEALVLDFKLR